MTPFTSPAPCPNDNVAARDVNGCGNSNCTNWGNRFVGSETDVAALPSSSALPSTFATLAEIFGDADFMDTPSPSGVRNASTAMS